MRANRIDRQMNPGEQMQDRRTDRSIEKSNLGQMDRQIDRGEQPGTDGQTGGWMYGWVDRHHAVQTDEQTHPQGLWRCAGNPTSSAAVGDVGARVTLSNTHSQNIQRNRSSPQRGPRRVSEPVGGLHDITVPSTP